MAGGGISTAFDAFFSSWFPIIFALIGGFAFAFRQYLRGTPYQSKKQLKKETVLVTGATSGMGQAAATDFASRGARVIMACRDIEAGQKIAQEIQKKTNNTNVTALHCDLSSLDSVRKFVEEFKKRESQLHILINNAGVMMCPKTLSTDKFEMQFAVNYLGPFLLTHLLLDTMKASAPARIVNVTAHAHQLGSINFDDLNHDEDYNPGHAYAQSKLAVAMFTITLAKYLEGSEVIVNCINPGIVNTNLHRHMPFRAHSFINMCFSPFVWYMFKKPEDGINTMMFCALEDALGNTSGKYFVECCPVNWHETTQDEDVQKKLWEESLKWTDLKLKS
ncbi:retinol dehydrogenase 13 [Octopus sinensis]|uniref:Retinol dehydrogenase 13 n=1 Tax=Octopus sinensis TaxID=2607531 RepID=A0A6P7SWK0_9MOLL|nr:retinol dehydrogenase 13 [Octopus sinensis]